MSGAAGRTGLVIEPPRGLSPIDLRELWAYRELFGVLVWREVSVRYKQSVLGILWAVLNPVLMVLIFSLVFGRGIKVPTDGIPYPIFSFTGLLPWLFFSRALAGASGSMVGQAHLITKVYFPRLIVPGAATLVPLVDFALAFVILGAMMVYYGYLPSPQALVAVPACVLWAWATALGVGLWLGALAVYFRDVGHLVPFIIQVWLYASPVIYPARLFPQQWQWLYGLNPMAGILEVFRWSLLREGHGPSASLLAPAAISTALLVSGLYFFRRMERTFADVV